MRKSVMKANELRIGNWVEHNQPKRGYYTTVQESTFSVNVEKLFKPIPLTEEWLLKFGFEKTTKWNNVQHTKGILQIRNLYILFVNGRNQSWINLKHVHQLQNLYFALTGEELTINEL
jgi:hypothetical protein